MIRRLLAALLVAAAPGLAQAQFAVIAPDTPVGDSTNRIVNTRALRNTLLTGLPLTAGMIWIGSSANLATPRTPSGDCTISQLGVIVCTQASGNFTINGVLTVTGNATFGGSTSTAGPATFASLATFNAGATINGGATVNGTLTVNGWIVDRFGGLTINGTRQPSFAWALPLTPGGIVFQDWAGLNVLQSPFPNKMLMSGFKGQPPKWTQTTWADSYSAYSLLYSNGPNSVQGLATCLSGVIVTSSSGVPSCSVLGTGIATWLATPSSANLRAALTDESGTGSAYFQGGDLGTPSAGVLTNATGYTVANLSDVAWSTFTPVVTAGGGGTPTSTKSVRYKQIGKTIFLLGSITITANNGGTTDIRMTLPVAPAQNAYGVGVESGLTGKLVWCKIVVAQQCFLKTYDNLYPGGDGAIIEFSIFYEVS